MINLTIVEQNGKIKEGIAYLISQSTEINCGASHRSYESLLKNFSGCKPDVILLDLDINPDKALITIKHCKKINPAISIIAVSDTVERDLIYRALQLGASGFIEHNTPPIKVVNSIKEAFEGGAPLSAYAAKQIVEHCRDNGCDMFPQTDYDLSPREKEVLNCLVNGAHLKEIASKLSISIETVRFHFKNIYRKMNVHNQAELVAKSLRERVI